MNFHRAVLADFFFFFCSKVHFKFLCIVLMSAYILVTFYFFLTGLVNTVSGIAKILGINKSIYWTLN